MGIITPGTFEGNPRFMGLDAEQCEREFHPLREPLSWGSAVAWDNLGYQMQYSIESLEKSLAEDKAWHVLQINLDWHDDDWQNPTYWHLFADGREVAGGTGDFARECFEESPTRFCEVCHEAVCAAGFPALSADEYRILSMARAIAGAEPYNNASGELGSKKHRVY